MVHLTQWDSLPLGTMEIEITINNNVIIITWQPWIQFPLKEGEKKKTGRQIKKQPVHVSIGHEHEHFLEDRQRPREPHWELQGEQGSPSWEQGRR